MNPAGLDAYYTPAEIAREIASALPIDLVGPVLDPTVGRGALLSAVGDRFAPDSVRLLGIDVDAAVLRSLRAERRDWTLSQADLLSARSRRASAVWRLAKRDLGAVVLNPPFSYRGNGGAMAAYDGVSGRVAPAMQFLLTVLSELAPRAGVFAILPDGALDADRHESLWAAIKRHHRVVRVSQFKTTSFAGARVATSMVHISPSAVKIESMRENSGVGGVPVVRPRSTAEVCRCLEIVRGRVPVHRVPSFEAHGDQVPFVHTTDLSRMARVGSRLAPARLSDEAPLVIVSRVGRWTSPVPVDIGRVVLSDCLFGLRPRLRELVPLLMNDLDREHMSFRERYKGTAARYLTLAELEAGLEELSWHVHIVRAGSDPGDCCCGAVERRCGGIEHQQGVI